MPEPLWITYAWKDNDEGNFDFLVQELAQRGVRASYDKVALVPGLPLWEQIGNRIMNGQLAGWAYLITPNSIASLACKEELAYALYRTLTEKAAQFPLIGLLHGVSITDVPPPLKVRLCVNLANPDWKEEVRAAVESRPPARQTTETLPYIVKQHRDYLGQRGKTAIEVRPRFGEVGYWRFAFPAQGAQPTDWGVGPANGGGISPVASSSIESTVNVEEIDMKVVGTGDGLSANRSAYIVFESASMPQKVYFGKSSEPLSLAMEGYFINL